jgi:hypothetical protein
MGTFISKYIVDEIIARDGQAHPEDSPEFDVVRIVRYASPEGDPNNWGVVYRCEIAKGMLHRYDNETAVIRNPKVIFERNDNGILG